MHTIRKHSRWHPAPCRPAEASVDAHTDEQVHTADDAGEDQHLHRVCQRVKPERLDGDRMSEERLGDHSDNVSEETAEQCAPDKGGDSAEGKHLDQLRMPALPA